MRKLFVLMLALVLALSVCGCGGNSADKAPDFETYNMTAISAKEALASGTAYPYTTVCQAEPEKATTGTVKVLEYKDVDSPDGKSPAKGCKWVSIKLELNFGDEAANESGYTYSYKLADYYNIKNVQDSMCYDMDKACETFQIRSEGKKYNCKGLVAKSSGDWAMNDVTGLQNCSEFITWTFMIPENYDGLCCGLFNSSKESIVNGSSYIYELQEDPGFLFFRLD